MKKILISSMLTCLILGCQVESSPLESENEIQSQASALTDCVTCFEGIRPTTITPENACPGSYQKWIDFDNAVCGGFCRDACQDYCGFDYFPAFCTSCTNCLASQGLDIVWETCRDDTGQ